MIIQLYKRECKQRVRRGCQSVQSERHLNCQDKSEPGVTNHLGTHRTSLLHLALKADFMQTAACGGMMREV